jgi:hypothetical protein
MAMNSEMTTSPASSRRGSNGSTTQCAGPPGPDAADRLARRKRLHHAARTGTAPITTPRRFAYRVLRTIAGCGTTYVSQRI